MMDQVNGLGYCLMLGRNITILNQRILQTLFDEVDKVDEVDEVDDIPATADEVAPCHYYSFFHQTLLNTKLDYNYNNFIILIQSYT